MRLTAPGSHARHQADCFIGERIDFAPDSLFRSK
jgi:hypothetical protein